MPKVLVIHGAGMNVRGKAQIDVFGTGFGIFGYYLALRGIRELL
jgi:3-dehydroquinate dehydratase